MGDERARACTSAFKMHGMTNCNSRDLKNSEEGAGGTSGVGGTKDPNQHLALRTKPEASDLERL